MVMNLTADYWCVGENPCHPLDARPLYYCILLCSVNQCYVAEICGVVACTLLLMILLWFNECLTDTLKFRENAYIGGLIMWLYFRCKLICFFPYTE